MITPIFEGTVNSLKNIAYKDEVAFGKWMNSLIGKNVDVIVRAHRKQRSKKENDYYWGVVIRMVADEMGILDDEAHEYLKALFLKKGVEVNGRRYEVIRSTTTLSTTEFEYFVSKCRIWASTELQLEIPEPHRAEWQ